MTWGRERQLQFFETEGLLRLGDSFCLVTRNYCLFMVAENAIRAREERGERRLEQTNLNSEFATVDAIYLCVFSGHQ